MDSSAHDGKKSRKLKFGKQKAEGGKPRPNKSGTGGRELKAGVGEKSLTGPRRRMFA
jgi:hypothetical protein